MKKTIWDSSRLANPHAQPDKAKRVQAMFNEIAPRYELINRIMSGGRDAYWRRRAVEMASIRPDDRILDLACGTGDFARAFAKAAPAGIIGIDFSERMLALAGARTDDSIRWCRGDALALPYRDEAFSLVGCAFGVRNFQDLSAGLREIHRVLVPGGRVLILEFTMPDSRILRGIYSLYFQHVLPRMAGLISRSRSGAYHYLPQSVQSFVNAEGMIDGLDAAGFSRTQSKALTMGIVTVHLAWKKS